MADISMCQNNNCPRPAPKTVAEWKMRFTVKILTLREYRRCSLMGAKQHAEWCWEDLMTSMSCDGRTLDEATTAALEDETPEFHASSYWE